ncbi:MAG: hypothetical protein OEV93_04130, partial [Candidatus Moranbacteria bacterium]|nr:hypothetical protein [Candidatus Moranbacteria bacterium]
SQNAPMPPKVSQNAPITTPVNSRISRSSGSAMELGSNFHEENGEHLDTSNITGIKFDAPHKFPEEK